MARLTFEERNKNNYTKYSDVPIKTINKYKGVLPEELLTIWQNMGYGIYEDTLRRFRVRSLKSYRSQTKEGKPF